MNPSEAPRRGLRPSEIAKRKKLDFLISKIREKNTKVDKKS